MTWVKTLERHLTNRILANERALVDNRGRARWLFWAGAFGVVVVLGAAIARPLLPEPWDSIAVVVLCWFAGAGVMRSYLKALSYRNGWLDGRHSILNAMAEAMERDLTPAEWLTAELEREAAVLGIPPPQVDDLGD